MGYLKKINTFFLGLLLVLFTVNINAQCPPGETEIDFVASGVSGGWSDYALLIGASSSYLINTPGSNIECIPDGLCYTVNLVGNAVIEIYQGGVLVATPADGETICIPFVVSVPGCTDSLANNYDAAATLDDGSCCYTLTVVDTACGEYLFGANLLDSSGTYLDTFTAMGGCDSIVTLELTIFQDSSVTYITACDSAEWNGVWYYNDTIITDTGFVTTNSFGGATVESSGKEGNIWYFGEYAGLDFNSGAPVALTDGQLNTLEGCASISDNNGDLLFYTDGMTVYNKNHTIMPNGTGLLGHNSSTQSGVIIQQPGSATIYYLFTVDGMSGTGGDGMYYSEVDMTLQTGDGDINANKNIPVVPNTCEKITVVKHQNNVDFWVVARLENSNTYHSYLLTSSGLNMTPVVTNIGPAYFSVIGYLKSSNNGANIAAANWTTSDINLMDFDNSTGILSNVVTFSHGGYAYGLEFSPDGNLLYAGDVASGNIYQYDLLNANIQSSQLLLGTVPLYGTESAAALQLAPDNRIYIANLFAPHLSVIENPDILGLGCNFNPNGINLAGRTSLGGFPTFYSSIFNTFPAGCDSVATAIIDIKNSSSTYNQVAQCDSFTWALNGQTYYISQIDTIQSTNIDGCQHIDSLDLTIYPEINLSATITDELCVNYSDGSITLNVTGGLGTFSYSWIGPGAFSEITKDIFNLSPGSYDLTITDLSSLCTKDTTFIVAAGFDMQINILSIDISCYDADDGIIDVIPVNLVNPIYTWSDTLISLEDRVNMPPGIYYLQIDDNNCFLRDTFEFTEPDSLFIISEQTSSVCIDGNWGEISVQAFGGTPSYNFYWSNWSGNNSDNLNLSPGIYDLDVYDANGCLYEETFIIEPYQLLVSSDIDNIDCFGDSTGSVDLTLSGGFSPYYYLWSDSTTAEDIYNLSEGAITCTISDYFGCTLVESFMLTEETPIQVVETISNVSCYGGNDGSANLTISGGVGPYSIDWYNADENNLFEGTYNYEVTDANGCIYNDNIYIAQEDTLDILINVVDVDCPADSNGAISIYIFSGGVSPYSFSWIGPDSFTSSQQDIDSLYSGVYTLELSDLNNCSFEYQITVSEPIDLWHNVDTLISDYTTYNISCYGGNDGWISVIPNGGYVPYEFLWSTGNQTSSIDNLIAGTYSVTITNGIGCKEDFVFNLLQPVETLSGVLTSLYDYNGFDVSCFAAADGAISVNVQGGVGPYSYYWNNQSGEYILGENPHDSIQGGVHNLELVDNNGCSYFDAIVLEQPDLVEWVINISPDTCEKGVGMLDVNISGGISPYTLTLNDLLLSNVIVGSLAINAVEGEYSLIFEDANQCISKDTVTVYNLAAPEMDFDIMSDYERLYEQKKNPIVFVDMTELSWQHAYSWDWDYGDGNFGSDSVSFHSYEDIGVYYVTLTITTDYNCIDTLTKKVVVDEYDLHIPNAFTPDSDDNFNNGFRPYGIGIDKFLMNIYTRWGELIYSTENIEQEWNGKYRNIDEICQVGVYIYYIEVKDIFGAIHKYEGQVNLIR